MEVADGQRSIRPGMLPVIVCAVCCAGHHGSVLVYITLAVKNVLPQTVLGNASWQASRHWMFAVQADWTNWHDSFVNLPVTLTNGSNATISSVVGSSTLQDVVPLRWKDQYGVHIGAERTLTENTVLRFGYAP